MKKLITFFVFITALFLPQAHFSQSLTYAGDLDPDCEKLKLRVVASFNFGSGYLCPQLQSHTLTNNNGALTVDLFYNADGAWPAHFCSRTDTVYYTLPQNATSLLVKMNVLYNGVVSPVNSSSNIPVCQVTAIKENSSALPFKIFPNPAKDKLNIETSRAADIKSITIIDISGKEVFSSDYKSVLNVSSLPQGLYFLKLKTTDGVMTTKFVKTE